MLLVAIITRAAFAACASPFAVDYQSYATRIIIIIIDVYVEYAADAAIRAADADFSLALRRFLFFIAPLIRSPLMRRYADVYFRCYRMPRLPAVSFSYEALLLRATLLRLPRCLMLLDAATPAIYHYAAAAA